MPSSPTARRTKPWLTPAFASASPSSCECVVEAGWMTRERTSPMFATCEWSSSASTNATAASKLPVMSKPWTQPAPFDR